MDRINKITTKTSLLDYREAIGLSERPFNALIMAAMRKANAFDREKLKAAFPQVWVELTERYNAPNGCIDDFEMRWLLGILEESERQDE